MAGRRTKLEQVKSGFRIAGWIIFSLLFAAALAKGFQFALGRDEDPTLLRRSLGLVLVIVLSVVLYKSVRTWAKWFAGFIALSTFKVLGASTTGREVYPPHKPVPRQFALELLVWVFVTSYLLYYAHLHKLKSWEKAGAVAVPLSTALYVVVETGYSDPKLLFVGPVLLFLSLVPRFLRSWKKAHPASPEVSPSTVDGIK